MTELARSCGDRAPLGMATTSASEEAFAEAARLAAAASAPVEDQRGPVDYKRHLAGELTRRVLRSAAQRAGAGALPAPIGG